MHIVISDDYQDAVRSLACFGKLAGHKVTIHNDTVTGIDALATRFADAEAVVLIRERTRFGAELLERLPRLKLISQTGRAGPQIDTAACTRRGVLICETNGSPHAPAELTWGLVLAASRHIALEDRRMRAGLWQTTLGVSLRGRVLGIYGYGKIGKIVAGYGKAFGMRVMAWGREGTLERARNDGIETAASKQQLFAESDVLSLHLRLAPETRNIVTASDFAQMKSSAILINISRAELIASGALEQALKQGRPGFAGIDVFEGEPLLGGKHPLLAMDNVVCTPHLGYVVKENYEMYFGSAFDNILAFAAGKPVNVFNPEALSRS